MLKQKHKHLGAITYTTMNTNTGTGTGLLISPNLVLTAAHVVFDKKISKYNTNLKFHHGVCGKMN